MDGRHDQLTGATRRGRDRIALRGRDESQTGRGRGLDDGAGVAVDQRERRLDWAPERILDLRPDGTTAKGGAEHLERALAAVGDWAPIDRPTGALEAAGDRGGHLERAERALEGVWRDQDHRRNSRHRGHEGHPVRPGATTPRSS